MVHRWLVHQAQAGGAGGAAGFEFDTAAALAALYEQDIGGRRPDGRWGRVASSRGGVLPDREGGGENVHVLLAGRKELCVLRGGGRTGGCRDHCLCGPQWRCRN